MKKIIAFLLLSACGSVFAGDDKPKTVKDYRYVGHIGDLVVIKDHGGRSLFLWAGATIPYTDIKILSADRFGANTDKGQIEFATLDDDKDGDEVTSSNDITNDDPNHPDKKADGNNESNTADEDDVKPLSFDLSEVTSTSHPKLKFKVGDCITSGEGSKKIRQVVGFNHAANEDPAYELDGDHFSTTSESVEQDYKKIDCPAYIEAIDTSVTFLYKIGDCVKHGSRDPGGDTDITPGNIVRVHGFSMSRKTPTYNICVLKNSPGSGAMDAIFGTCNHTSTKDAFERDSEIVDCPSELANWRK